jgi:hypothetical protein
MVLAEALCHATAHARFSKATATPFPTEGAKFAYRTLPVIKIHIKSPFRSSSEMNRARAFAACVLSRFPYKITSFRWIHLIYREQQPENSSPPMHPNSHRGLGARKGRDVRHSLTAGVISNLRMKKCSLREAMLSFCVA